MKGDRHMQFQVAQRFWRSGVMEWNNDRIIVQSPLIYEEEGAEGGKSANVMRWDSSDGRQREFRLAITPKRLNAMCHLSPDLFSPIFIGQLRDLPEKSSLRAKILKLFSCGEDEWVMLASAPFTSVRRKRRDSLPAHFITRIAIKRNIHPIKYVNMNAWYEAEMEIHPSKKAASRKSLPEQNKCLQGL